MDTVSTAVVLAGQLRRAVQIDAGGRTGAPTAGVVRPSCVEIAIAAVRPLQQVACRSRSHIRTAKLFGCSLRTELGLVRCWPIDCRQLVSVSITQLSTHIRRAMND